MTIPLPASESIYCCMLELVTDCVTQPCFDTTNKDLTDNPDRLAARRLLYYRVMDGEGNFVGQPEWNMLLAMAKELAEPEPHGTMTLFLERHPNLNLKRVGHRIVLSLEDFPPEVMVLPQPTRAKVQTLTRWYLQYKIQMACRSTNPKKSEKEVDGVKMAFGEAPGGTGQVPGGKNQSQWTEVALQVFLYFHVYGSMPFRSRFDVHKNKLALWVKEQWDQFWDKTIPMHRLCVILWMQETYRLCFRLDQVEYSP